MHGCTYAFFSPARVPVLLFFASADLGEPAPSLRACMVALTRSFRRNTFRFCFSSPRPPGGAQPRAYVHAWLHLRVLFAGTRSGFAFLRLGRLGERGPEPTCMHGCTYAFFSPARVPVLLFFASDLGESGPEPTCMHGCTYAFFSPARVPVLLFFASAPGGARPEAYVHALPAHVPVLLFFASAAEGSPAPSLRACITGTCSGFAFLRLGRRGESTGYKQIPYHQRKSLKYNAQQGLRHHTTHTQASRGQSPAVHLRPGAGSGKRAPCLGARRRPTGPDDGWRPPAARHASPRP